MIRLELLLGLATLGLWIFSVVDVIGSEEGAIRHLPKVGWILIVLFFPLAGSIAWLVAGRPERATHHSAHGRAVPQFPEYDRPGRAAAVDPSADEEFLRQVRERAEEQRRAYREERRRRETEDDRTGDPDPESGPR
jgi:hypothetical protein